MNSLFSNATIENIKNIKKTFLWVAVCILIGEVVVGAILILAQSFNETIGRLMGTFALCAVALFVGVNNFTRMEKGERLVQEFALVSLIANIVWLVLSILLIWEIIPFMEPCEDTSYRYSSCYPSTMTFLAKLMMVAVNVALSCFLISNVWSIEETVKPVRPLKITALICELYCGIYAVVMTFGDVRYVADMRWSMLSALMGLAFIVMAIAAVIVSRNGSKKIEKEIDLKEKNMSDAEMQAKIQEMVEKEVQARMAAQGVSSGPETPKPVAGSGEPEVGGDPRPVPDSVYPEIKKD